MSPYQALHQRYYECDFRPERLQLLANTPLPADVELGQEREMSPNLSRIIIRFSRTAKLHTYVAQDKSISNATPETLADLKSLYDVQVALGKIQVHTG